MIQQEFKGGWFGGSGTSGEQQVVTPSNAPIGVAIGSRSELDAVYLEIPNGPSGKFLVSVGAPVFFGRLPPRPTFKLSNYRKGVPPGVSLSGATAAAQASLELLFLDEPIPTPRRRAIGLYSTPAAGIVVGAVAAVNKFAIPAFGRDRIAFVLVAGAEDVNYRILGRSNGDDGNQDVLLAPAAGYTTITAGATAGEVIEGERYDWIVVQAYTALGTGKLYLHAETEDPD